MWKQVRLLGRAHPVGQGGLGLWGIWGPRFFPQQSESQVFEGLISHRQRSHRQQHLRLQGCRRGGGGGRALQLRGQPFLPGGGMERGETIVV